MGVRRSYLRTEGDPIFKPLPVFLPATEQGGGGLNLKENAMIQHDSDCAVHNGPALPPGPCNCGAQAKYERRWIAYLYQRGCTHLTRRRIAFGTWLGRRFCQARTDATRALCLTCYRLLFGKRAARNALRWWCRARKAQRRAGIHRM